MNFAPLWRQVLSGKIDLFQVVAICHIKGETWVSPEYVARKFNKFVEREQFDPYARLYALRGVAPLLVTE